MKLAIAILAGLSVCAPGAAARQDADAPPPAAAGNKFPLQLPSSTGAPSAAPKRSGSLAIRAVQGTKGGPLIANAPVEVELYHRGMLIDVIDTELDEHGVVIVEDLPIAMGLQPVVKVAWADVTYQQVGPVMDPSNPDQTLEVACYELTDEEPAWRVRMRHVMVAPGPGGQGLQITEVLAIENPSDHTWIGRVPAARNSAGDAPGRAVTTAFAVPDDALSVSLGRGFHDWCCTTFEGGALKNHLPLMPRTTEMIYSYIVRSHKGTAVIDVIAPDAPGGIEHVMILVPATLQMTSFTGLEDAGVDTMGDTPTRVLMASNVEPGAAARITLAGLAAEPGGGAAAMAKMIAIIGGIVILLVAAGVILRRPAAQNVQASNGPQVQVGIGNP